MTKNRINLLLASILSVLSIVAFANNTWSTFNGDLKAQKYSSLTQITPQNVKDLKVTWKNTHWRRI